MKKRYMIGYCDHCRKNTKQEVIKGVDSVPWRIFETVATLGFALLTFHDYECECTRCGEINTLRQE